MRLIQRGCYKCGAKVVYSIPVADEQGKTRHLCAHCYGDQLTLAAKEKRRVKANA